MEDEQSDDYDYEMEHRLNAYELHLEQYRYVYENQSVIPHYLLLAAKRRLELSMTDLE